MQEWIWIAAGYVYAAMTIAVCCEAKSFWRGLLALLWPVFFPLFIIEYLASLPLMDSHDD